MARQPADTQPAKPKGLRGKFNSGKTFRMGNSDLIGSAEACDILAIDRGTLVRRIAAGKLSPAAKMPGGRGPYVFERAEVLRHKAEVDGRAKAAASP